MRVLLLINAEEELERSVSYATRISAATDEIHCLAIIPVSGDIPTQRNGQVLDVCTEFDLGPMQAEKAEMEQRLALLDMPDSWKSSQVLIGNRAGIISDQVASLSPDILLSATELSSQASDLFRHTHASELRKRFELPVMTYKCDRSKEAIHDIALISDYSPAAEIDIHLVRHIAATTGAHVSTYGFVAEEDDIDMMKARMNTFIAQHGLGEASPVVIVAKDKEKGAKDLLMSYPIQLMVLVDLHREGIRSLLKGDLESDILDHTAIPILAY